jgi:hypothetical protein
VNLFLVGSGLFGAALLLMGSKASASKATEAEAKQIWAAVLLSPTFDFAWMRSQENRLRAMGATALADSVAAEIAKRERVKVAYDATINAPTSDFAWYEAQVDYFDQMGFPQLANNVRQRIAALKANFPG